jgi:putative acetyltransferase
MHELHTRSVVKLCGSHYSEREIEAWLSGRTPEGYVPAIERGEMFVAERDLRVVGFGHARPGEVAAVFVDPDAAGEGVGGALLRRAVELARQDHDGPVVIKSTVNAAAFYEAHGFVEVGRSSVRKRDVDLPIVVMELHVSP